MPDSGDLYKVSWDEQRLAAGYVDKAIGTIQAELDTINTETSALLAVWDDSSSQAAYQGRQATWTKAATDIVGALGSFKASLFTSADISEGTESMNATTMAG